MTAREIQSIARIGESEALREAVVQSLDDAKDIIKGMGKHDEEDSQWIEDLKMGEGRINDALDIIKFLQSEKKEKRMPA